MNRIVARSSPVARVMYMSRATETKPPPDTSTQLSENENPPLPPPKKKFDEFWKVVTALVVVTLGVLGYRMSSYVKKSKLTEPLVSDFFERMMPELTSEERNRIVSSTTNIIVRGLDKRLPPWSSQKREEEYLATIRERLARDEEGWTDEYAVEAFRAATIPPEGMLKIGLDEGRELYAKRLEEYNNKQK